MDLLLSSTILILDLSIYLSIQCYTEQITDNFSFHVFDKTLKTWYAPENKRGCGSAVASTDG